MSQFADVQTETILGKDLQVGDLVPLHSGSRNNPVIIRLDEVEMFTPVREGVRTAWYKNEAHPVSSGVYDDKPVIIVKRK